jgi:hypothetical protein
MIDPVEQECIRHGKMERRTDNALKFDSLRDEIIIVETRGNDSSPQSANPVPCQMIPEVLKASEQEEIPPRRAPPG